MAPNNGDAAVVTAAQAPAPAPKKQAARRQASKPRRISMEGLQRAMSDLALELSRDSKWATTAAAAAAASEQLPAIAEQHPPPPPPPPAEDQEELQARCECCGMQEECTPEYVRRVRARYSGRWVCGLCAAAVSAEAEGVNGGGGGGGSMEEAVAAHMAVCGRFNRVGRANPVRMQTEAMREILRKRTSRSKSNCNSPREHGGALARSSSCIPAITKDLKSSID